MCVCVCVMFIMYITHPPSLHIQAIEFFFFAGLMFMVTIVFAIMSFFYKYVDLSSDEDKPSSRDSAYSSKSHDESSALVAANQT